MEEKYLQDMVALNSHTLIMYKHWGLQSQHFVPTGMETVFCFHKQNICLQPPAPV